MHTKPTEPIQTEPIKADQITKGICLFVDGKVLQVDAIVPIRVRGVRALKLFLKPLEGERLESVSKLWQWWDKVVN